MLCRHTGRDNADSGLLSSLALKRRTRFDDRSAAVASWGRKLPFSKFDSRALQLYAQHGLRDLPGLSTTHHLWCDMVRSYQPCSKRRIMSAEGGVTLVTDAPRVEAWIYILIGERGSQHND
jgi:hypothetical protein